MARADAVPMKRARAKRAEPAPKVSAPVPTFADVARMVTGTDPPSWLTAHLERWAPSLTLDCLVWEKQPTKAVMRKRLAEGCCIAA
jgi:hypothetical protein